MIDFDSITTENLWYFVGLIATDGCLSSDGRHVDITASDPLFLKSLRKGLGISNVIGCKSNGTGLRQYRIQIGGVAFYDFLISIGLVPRKSKLLGPIKVPREYFSSFLRGVIDGDGSIRSWRHPSNLGLQWSLRIYSASAAFISWLNNEIAAKWDVNGAMHQDRKLYVLKFGKMAAQRILKDCYYDSCLCLQRKRRIALDCVCAANGWETSQTLGRWRNGRRYGLKMGLPGGDVGVINPSNSGNAKSCRPGQANPEPRPGASGKV